MAALPTSKVELIAALRALLERVPQTREELQLLQDESVALALHVQRQMAIHDVPEAVWHFLSDPDIRFKDPAYAEMQLSELGEVLARWQSESGI